MANGTGGATSGTDFVVTRHLGTDPVDEYDADGDDSGATGDERASNGAVAGDAGFADRGNDGFVDPTSTISDSGDAPFGYTPTGRKRKRPVGSGTRSGSTYQRGTRASAQATNDVAEILAMIHWGLATALKTPEIQLTEDEAAKLGSSITRLTELYGNIPGMDEKTMAWMKFAGVASTIYGTRLMVMVDKRKRSKSGRPQQPRQHTGVVEMPGAIGL